MFGVETVLRPRADKKSGKWHRGVFDAAETFMTRCHKGDADKSWLRLATEDAKIGDKGKPGGRGGTGSRTDTAVDES